MGIRGISPIFRESGNGTQNAKDKKVTKTPESIVMDSNKTKQQIYSEIRSLLKDKLDESLDPTSKMSDEEKADYERRINEKIKNGEKLTEAELQYIRIKSPYLYTMIARVQMQRQALEDRLKSCKSKEEVQDTYNFYVSNISKKDPAKEPLMAAYDNVTTEFKKTFQYKSLPEKRKDVKDNDVKFIETNHKSNKLEKSEMDHKYFRFENHYDYSAMDKKA